MQRRTFLKVSAGSAGSLIVSFNTSAYQTAVSEQNVQVKPMGYIEITADNQINFNLTKLEMGQGVGTGYLTIVAEELNTHPDLINVKQALFSNTSKNLYRDINRGTTGGSVSIRHGWMPLREAAATTLYLLTKAAANFWQIPMSLCQPIDGKITNKNNNNTLTFGDLTSLAATLKIPDNVSLKPAQDFRFIGHAQSGYLTPKISTGALTYGIDKRIEGLKHASVLHCPTLDGEVVRFNRDEITSLTGVIDVIVISRKALLKNAKSGDPLDDSGIRSGIAVIANSTWSAMKAIRALRVEWLHIVEKHDNTSLRKVCTELLEAEGEILMTHGELSSAIDSSIKRFTKTYLCPYASHHYMEPLNAIAHYQHGKMRIYAGTQNPDRDVYAISNALAVAESDIEVEVLPTGGSFGRKYNPDFTLESAFLAKTLDYPVKVLWSREDEVACGQQADFEMQKFSVEFDERNEIKGYQWHSVISGKWVSEVNMYLSHIPNFSISLSRRIKTLQLAPWRAVQTARTNFGAEVFIDELAYKQGKEPLSYRLSMLAKKVNLPNLPKEHQWLADYVNHYRSKYITVLKRAADKTQWHEKKASFKQGTGLGISAGAYGGTALVIVVEASVKGTQLCINQITAVVDCGIVIDKSAAEHQIVGAIIWGLNALFTPETQFKDSQITQSNFHDAPILRSHQIPPIETHFLPSDDAPTGLGEPGVCAIMPAVINAIYAACGKRIRTRNITEFQLVSASELNQSREGGKAHG